MDQIKQHFWSRWSSEYLTNCQQRTNWKANPRVKFEKNQPVMVKMDESLPLKWILGRIVEFHAGQDEMVKVVTVPTEKETYKSQ